MVGNPLILDLLPGVGTNYLLGDTGNSQITQETFQPYGVVSLAYSFWCGILTWGHKNRGGTIYEWQRSKALSVDWLDVLTKPSQLLALIMAGGGQKPLSWMVENLDDWFLYPAVLGGYWVRSKTWRAALSTSYPGLRPMLTAMHLDLVEYATAGVRRRCDLVRF